MKHFHIPYTDLHDQARTSFTTPSSGPGLTGVEIYAANGYLPDQAQMYLQACVDCEIRGVIRENEGKAAPQRLHLDPALCRPTGSSPRRGDATIDGARALRAGFRTVD
jgi:hypothetical protein